MGRGHRSAGVGRCLRRDESEMLFVEDEMTDCDYKVKSMPTGYVSFIATKLHVRSDGGFAPKWMPGVLFPFQSALVEWATRKGRAAIFADCGLGKTPIQLVWAENVVRHTSRPVLILTPLAVGSQTVKEGVKFGVECQQSRDGKYSAKVVITNYQKLHLFDPNDFAGVVCDESSILKDDQGTTRAAVTEFMRKVPYRLLCTATAAPNDYAELGTSSEALGEMGYQDMASKFFRKETSKYRLGWGRTKLIMRTHAERDFWRWVCSWSRSIRKPSDMGFDDGPFVLPPLATNEHVIEAKTKQPGRLFDVTAVTLQEQREERRRTINERCEKSASLLQGKEPGVAWCHLNDEGDLLTELIDGAEQVSGADSDERKEELLTAFAAGQVRVLVTKPELAGFGLNWQHCNRQTFFPSHSFERYYQAVRRCWRFGQKRPVTVDIVTSEGEAGVLGNLNSKATAAERMFENLVSLMNDSLKIQIGTDFKKHEVVPSWLLRTK